MSDSAETFASWATHVTKCSNPTFSRVINRLWHNPPLQKDVLVVLCGITKLIQSRGGTESVAEYYAAILSLLNTNSSTKLAEAYLLRLVLSKAVPVALLRRTCSEASKTITNVLYAALQEDPLNIPMCKYLLLALGRVLSAQPSENWASESVRHTFRIFLQFIDHDNATLRKASHAVITELLASSLSREDNFHPVCHQTVNQICRLIRNESSQLSSLIRISDIGCSRLLHCLNALKSILCLVPEKDVKACCECVLEQTSFNNSLVVKSSFETLQTVFEGRIKVSSLSLEMTGKLMTAIFKCKPRDSTAVDVEALQKESASVIAWLECLRAGVGYLTTIAVEKTTRGPTETAYFIAVEHLDNLLRAALNLINNSFLPVLRDSGRLIFVKLVSNELVAQLQGCNLVNHRPRMFNELFLSLQNSLTLARREIWPNLLNVSSHLIQVWANTSVSTATTDHVTHLPDEVIGLVSRVASLRDALVDGTESIVNASDIKVTVLIDEMDRLIFTSMESWGIDTVLLDALSLEPLIAELESGSVELRRSWILPLVARVHPARPASLAFFHNTILPLADRAIAVAKAIADPQTSRKIGGLGKRGVFVPRSAILNAAVQMARQLWTLLTPFTRRPPLRWADLIDSGLGRRLIAGLLTAKAVRPVILAALRRLVAFADTEEAVAVMRAGARQMVPRLLTMYEENDSFGDQQLQQQLQTTLCVFFPLLTPKMLSVPCEMAFKKLTTTEKPIYMEILMLIVPHLTPCGIKEALHRLEGYFPSENCGCVLLRKPAYRLLECILSSPSPTAKEFTDANLASLIAFMRQIAPHHLGEEEEEQQAAEDYCGLSTTMASLAVTKKKNKKMIGSGTPWKVRLRVLRLLLKALVEQEVDKDCDGEQDRRVEEFIDNFIPEIPPCMGSLNSVVRVVAGRLLVDMARAGAGRLSGGEEAREFFQSGRDQQRPSSDAVMGQGDADGDNEKEEEDEEFDYNDIDDDATSSVAPSEVASVCTVITTTGMDPDVAEKTCVGLHNILSRLWPTILDATTIATKPKDFQTANRVRMEVAAKAVCRLLSDVYLRRCLMTCLQTAEAEATAGGDAAAAILSKANASAQALVRLPNKPLAALGLQISRLLIAFIGRSVYVSDIVVCMQSVYDDSKHSLRFIVKAMIDKLLKKVSVQSLQSLMNPKYHKMIRNSAKIQLRRERKRKAEGKLPATSSSCDGGSDDDDASALQNSGRTSSVSGASLKSSKSVSSAVSLSGRIRVQNLNEILEGSDDDEEDYEPTNQRSENKKAVEPPKRRPGLAAELERAASVAGLSRRSRRLPAGLGLGDDVNLDDSDNDDGGTRRVRFADDLAASAGAGKKRQRSDQLPMTYLVEDADEEVLDLADPEAMARHLTVAPSAQLAKQALLNRSGGGLPSAKRSRRPTLLSASAFPITEEGKLVIDDAEKKPDNNDDWMLDEDSTPAYLPSLPSHLSAIANTAEARLSKQQRMPGSVYRSARAAGDMKKPGLPDPFAYVPLGAGIATKQKKRSKGGFASEQERRVLLRSLGAGKQNKKKQPHKTQQHQQTKKKGQTVAVGKRVGKKGKSMMKPF